MQSYDTKCVALNIFCTIRIIYSHNWQCFYHYQKIKDEKKNSLNSSSWNVKWQPYSAKLFIASCGKTTAEPTTESINQQQFACNQTRLPPKMKGLSRSRWKQTLQLGAASRVERDQGEWKIEKKETVCVRVLKHWLQQLKRTLAALSQSSELTQYSSVCCNVYFRSLYWLGCTTVECSCHGDGIYCRV